MTLFFFYFIICAVFSVLLTAIALIVAPSNDDLEKSSSYECGFEPFNNARIKFDIHFYLVAILFIIFDLEIVFLFPWCISAAECTAISPLGFWSMVIFLVILTIGFIYEWTKGALTWK